MKNNSIFKRIYLIDFVFSLMKFRKIPIIIYLLIDSLFAFIGVAVIMALFFNESGGMTDKQIMTYYAISLLIYLVAIIGSLSPIGEWILRLKVGCEDIREVCDASVENRLTILFNEVYEKAKKLDPTISNNIRLFIKQNSEEPNAFAIGRRSICVFDGLLALPDDQIKAILAHEFGHLSNKDTDLNLVVNIGNLFMDFLFLIGYAILAFYKIICTILSILMGLISESLCAMVGRIMNFIFSILQFVLIKFIKGAWNTIGSLLIKFANRNAEFEADEFAFNLGYGESLISFFKTLPDAVHRNGVRNFFNLIRRSFKAVAALSDTHPATWKRIEKLESKTNNTIKLDIISESMNNDFIELT